MTVAPLLSLDTLVTGAEGAAGIVLGDLKEDTRTSASQGENKSQKACPRWEDEPILRCKRRAVLPSMRKVEGPRR